MTPPLVSFITWNRMGLTVRNMTALLQTEDDFELHIVDSNSLDDTWDYLMSISDPRIKAVTRLDKNRGPVYAANYNLSRRKKDQFFITVDSDVNIHTPHWITRFMEAFEAFPEAGLLGAVSDRYYKSYRLPLVKRQAGEIYYLKLCKGFVEGCCQCFRPEVLELLGYWSEENCLGDVEMSYRVGKYTPYTSGFFPGVELDQEQYIACDACGGKRWCKLINAGTDCFRLREEKYRNPQFRNRYGWKYEQWLKESEKSGKEAFCASVHDEEAFRAHGYDKKSAEENFRFYELNSN